MVTASPAVSPSVVARTLTTQNKNVTCGTLVTSSDFSPSILCSDKHAPALGFACYLWTQLLQRNRAGQGRCALVANEKPPIFGPRDDLNNSSESDKTRTCRR